MSVSEKSTYHHRKKELTLGTKFVKHTKTPNTICCCQVEFWFRPEGFLFKSAARCLGNQSTGGMSKEAGPAQVL